MCSPKCSCASSISIEKVRCKNHVVAWEALMQCWSLSFFSPRLCESICFRWRQVQDLISLHPWLLPERHFHIFPHMVIDLKRPGEPHVEKRTKSRKTYDCHLSYTYFWCNHVILHASAIHECAQQRKVFMQMVPAECASYPNCRRSVFEYGTFLNLSEFFGLLPERHFQDCCLHHPTSIWSGQEKNHTTKFAQLT